MSAVTRTFVVPDPVPPCPTCPAPAQYAGITNWYTFGPCKDGRWHDVTCNVARKEMSEAKWPCGRRMYPDVEPY
jgi:hypothetical protein